MAPSRQNLFLFFEENERKTTIDRNLVRLYANRCIIDEDDGFEICGVYELDNVSDLMYDIMNPLYRTHAYQRTLKESNDRNILSDAFEKAHVNESNSIDSHFIIGSIFHAMEIEWATVTIKSRTQKLIEWMSEEMKSQEVKTIQVTFLCGYRSALATNKTREESYNGNTVLYHHASYPAPDPYKLALNNSVNDDFELTINHIRHGRRSQQTVNLFLYSMLTPHQLKLIETNDESYARTINNYLLGFGTDVLENELVRFPDSDPKLRFVRCSCLRHSLYLK